MKRVHYKSLVAAAILTGLSQQAATATELEKIYSSQDTWVNINHGGIEANNRGDKTDMKIDGNYTGFVQFVIPALPEGEVIDQVILELKVTGKFPIPDAYIAEITNPAIEWDETTVTEPTWPFEIADKIPGASIASDPAADPSTWTLQKGNKYQFDITSAVTGSGTYTFNVDSEFADVASGLKDRKFGAGVYTKDLSIQTGRPSLIVTTKTAPASDTQAPTFADVPVINIDATGTKTDISRSINVIATDDTDGDIAATIDGDTNLTSGSHTVTIQATDAAGNKATKEITVNIKPLIVLTAPEVVSLPSGASTTASVALSGPAVSYPATVAYTVTGDAASVDSGILTFNDPAAQDIEITLLGSATTDQTAVLSLTETTEIQASSETVTITAFEGNSAPNVSLTLMQADATIATISASNADTIPYIDATQGDITVTLNITDFNVDDTHAVDWATTSEALVATGTSFVFSPAELSGDFTLSVSATETNTTELFSSQTLTSTIKIIATALPELVADVDTDGDGINDIDEGHKDSDGDGILDYLDDNADITQLPLAEGQASLQTIDGLTLSLGSVSTDAKGVTAKSAVITLDDLASSVDADSADTTDTGFLPVEGASLFNFTVSGLTTPGDAAPVVYPLPEGVIIGEETEYRKYTPTAGWAKFVSDADNSIASAAKDETGNCPAPNDELYLDGLTAGDTCIQLTIKDGGIYDADGLENGSIEDPGVLAEGFELIQWSTNTIALPATNVNEGSKITLKDELNAYLGNVDISAVTFALEGDSSWLTVEETGALTADISKLTSGEHTATVSFNDNKTQTAQATVSVSVAYNNAPKLADIALATASRNEAYSASIAESITDAESDIYTIEKVAGPYWLKVSESGQLSGTPLKANIGDNNVTVKLTDAKGATNDVSFNVPVVDSSVRASEGGSFSAGLLTLLGLLSLRRKKAKK